MFHVLEKHRIRGGQLGSDKSFGNNGAFIFSKAMVTYFIIASDGDGWEHVSVHCLEDTKERTPSWDEMCLIKSLFWDEDDCVIQFHPAKSEYVNMHKHTLHLWRPTDGIIHTPDKLMVGF